MLGFQILGDILQYVKTLPPSLNSSLFLSDHSLSWCSDDAGMHTQEKQIHSRPKQLGGALNLSVGASPFLRSWSDNSVTCGSTWLLPKSPGLPGQCGLPGAPWCRSCLHSSFLFPTLCDLTGEIQPVSQTAHAHNTHTKHLR